MPATNLSAYRWGSSYSLSCLLLLPSPLVFQCCLLSSPSWFVFMGVVLLGCVGHPMRAASATACSSPKVAGAKWGHLPTALVPDGSCWSPGHPHPGHAIPTADAELLTQDSAGFWLMSAASSPFGHNLVLQMLCFTAPSLPSVFGCLSLNLSTSGGQILP